MTDRHPSFGNLTAEQVAELRDAKWDINYQANKMAQKKAAGSRGRRKKIKTFFMFTPETDGKNGK